MNLPPKIQIQPNNNMKNKVFNSQEKNLSYQVNRLGVFIQNTLESNETKDKLQLLTIKFIEKIYIETAKSYELNNQLEKFFHNKKGV